MTSPPSLEAKLVVLGSQGVGKTTLVHRYAKNTYIPPSRAQSTVGASFLTTRVSDPESGADIRLQIWDTAGQERFRSISRLYYRGANAAILCYDVTSAKSFEDMGTWLKELRENCAADTVIHVVGTKSDVVAKDPTLREVSFERCIGYVAEMLYPSLASTPGVGGGPFMSSPPTTAGGLAHLSSSQSNRLSGFWGQEQIWGCCHEVSSKDGEGIEEMFRVVTRKLVEQHARRAERQRLLEEYAMRGTPGMDTGGPGGGQGGYFDLQNGTGSFRLGQHGDKRRSWLGSLATPGGATSYGVEGQDEDVKGRARGRCC
ncbi:unnamed protein product [Zymoseptoria tritici ST99CH_1A5]|uniref:Ras-domain-containing protein n=4 Tax=Zymoseptoria tritici TaxID=1047171 RepID=A0A1X7RQ02_ZYMT9|nr:unnamed protein product [Zymoseptoria tritici ST99CH_3D7]SMR48875.1 unnamed protein product [Zymoseptoria tritici ST99CH_1E4]SMR50059.1 unnamed protein product [Zymoseptoria tritici ST99CH_3D1]SMY22759.1 unnamed protein product [Zymoseptoria tritici ST99CH_1A5]